jgi:hypothetical protein
MMVRASSSTVSDRDALNRPRTWGSAEKQKQSMRPCARRPAYSEALLQVHAE